LLLWVVELVGQTVKNVVKRYALSVMSYGLSVMGYGLCVMGYELWIMR